MTKRRLGRGLGSLLAARTEEPVPSQGVLEVPLSEIGPNPWQPRGEINLEELGGLIESIRTNGVLQPVVLRVRADGGYDLVAGERRWRAAIEAGLTDIPAVMRDVPDDQMLLLALLENVVRSDLNPIERAQGYARLMRELGLTQEQLAEQVGEARATVANTVRLLELPDEIVAHVSRGTISAGHGRALLSLKNPESQMRLCSRIIQEGLSVRQVEEIVGTARQGRAAPRTPKSTPPHIRDLEERFQRRLGAKVTIKERKKGGRISIDFFTHDDFERILALIETPAPPETPNGDFHV